MIVRQFILAKDNLVNTMRSKNEQITINIQIICEVVIQWLNNKKMIVKSFSLPSRNIRK